MNYQYASKKRRRINSPKIRAGLPALFTVGNAVAGFIAILSIADGEYTDAASFIFLAMLFDSMDGRVARRLEATSPFGTELDSLADAISFGVAPAFLVYSVWLNIYGTLGILASACLVIGGIARLARFNMLGPRPYFVGLPIPAVGAFLATLVISGLSVAPKQIALWSVLLSYLMVSSIKYPNFKQGVRSKNTSLFLFGFALLAVIVMVIEPNRFLIFPFLYYIIAGPILEAKRKE